MESKAGKETKPFNILVEGKIINEVITDGAWYLKAGHRELPRVAFEQTPEQSERKIVRMWGRAFHVEGIVSRRSWADTHL